MSTALGTAERARDVLGELVGLSAAGDENALAELYDCTSRLVFGLALRILGDRAAAEEVVIDVYAQVWRRAASWDARLGGARTWLLMLARSRAIDALRARRVRSGRELMMAELPDSVDPGASPEALSLRNEGAELVHRALATLPQVQRRAIEAAFFSGLSHPQVAEALGAPIGTVKTRIRRGLQSLRRQLEKSQPGAGR